MSPGAVWSLSMPGGTAAPAEICPAPTLLLGGQLSAWKASWLQRSAAFGSPTSPCGSTTRRLFTSSLEGFSENVESIVRSGWPPPAVVEGCSFTLVSDTAALAWAGSTAAASRARGTSQGGAVGRATGRG